MAGFESSMRWLPDKCLLRDAGACLKSAGTQLEKCDQMISVDKDALIEMRIDRASSGPSRVDGF